MTNKKTLYIIIVILAIVIIGGGLFFVLGNKGGQKEEQTSDNKNEMVDCGKLEKNPMCFLNRMSECLPVTAQLTGTEGTEIEITILGIENEKCHFQRKINGVQDLNCFFPKGTLNMDTLDQTFGNDKGLQSVVDDACKPEW